MNLLEQAAEPAQLADCRGIGARHNGAIEGARPDELGDADAGACSDPTELLLLCRRDADVEAFREALADDFNTPRAMALLAELITEANREEVPDAPQAVKEMLDLLGLGSLAGGEVIELHIADAIAISDEIETSLNSPSPEALLAEREKARAERDFGRADEIRDKLAELGWEVRDSAEGAKLVPKG